MSAPPTLLMKYDIYQGGVGGQGIARTTRICKTWVPNPLKQVTT